MRNLNGTERDGLVVVGVDGSAACRVALRFAAREADMRPARLRVVTVDFVGWPLEPPSTDTDMSALAIIMSPVVVAAEGLGRPIQVSMPRRVVRMVSDELAQWPSVPVEMEAW